MPSCLRAAEDLEQLLGLLRREDGGGLVQDHHLGAAEQDLQDLDPLLQADRQVGDQAVRVDLQAVVTLDLDQLGTGRLEAAADPEAVLGAQHQVLQNAEGLDQHEVLMDHADAGGDGVARAMDPHRSTIDQDLTPVGLVSAVEDLHQGRLAGAVFADDAVDAAGGDRQIDGAVGVDRAEALVHALELDRGGRPAHRSLCLNRPLPQNSQALLAM